MSLFFWLATIIGVLVGVITLVVIFCLLTMAQQADAHLDQLGLGEASGWPKPRQTGLAEIPEINRENSPIYTTRF